ncbi:class I SAM-dependent methyltransferase [Legionella sp. 16cNR16C]|uniref:class I SAM-dependent methyltransferase n=1 Tax=Legionella sp. 16cNR16C TaxID=2905656 RepID=UPI001E5160D2|nr:class I SAM-dependent methyltransferase [Legionella sp. 16cNR16C]MCE3044157.1 class I SAM-dependent methyltransferase [Legionella sp. 16cNR16C]
MNNEYELGLPLEYQQMPEYFDAHNVSEQTDYKNALIEKLLRDQGVKTVLDMTCGTGSQVFYLAERGYHVVGSDFSPKLLEFAREKAKAINKDIPFIDGDMRTLAAGQFDAVITIFNAIGHLTKVNFEKALRNIKSNLNEEGIYVFDIFNLEAITAERLREYVMDTEHFVNEVHIRHKQYSEVDREKGLLTSHDHYLISNGSDEPVSCNHRFSLQMYTAFELQTILERNGLDVIKQWDMEGNDFIAEHSISILTVARKKISR